MSYVFVLALGIGIVAGLRSLTTPAVAAWGAHLNWLNLHGSPLAFMGSTTAVAIFSLLAIGELIADKLPNTPKRTALAALLARIITGCLCGACLCAAAGKSLLAGTLLGGIGAIVGAFLGYEVQETLGEQFCTSRTSSSLFAKICSPSAWQYFLLRDEAEILLCASKRIDLVPSTCV